MGRKRKPAMEDNNTQSQPEVTPADTDQNTMLSEVNSPAPEVDPETSAASLPLVPTSVETVAGPTNTTEPEPLVRPGHVLLVALDPEGNEVGPPFTITEKGYKRTYSDESKFRLKKKAQ